MKPEPPSWNAEVSTMRSIYAIARRALLIAILVPAAAQASSWEMGNHGGTEGAGRGPLFNPDGATIGARDAAAIANYYGGLAANSHCPAGLIPDAAGCIPATSGEQLAAGQPIPRNVPVEPLPPDLNARLSPMYGFHYVRAGGEILLVANGSGVVAAAMPIFMR
jgi:hypothetical protein